VKTETRLATAAFVQGTPTGRASGAASLSRGWLPRFRSIRPSLEVLVSRRRSLRSIRGSSRTAYRQSKRQERRKRGAHIDPHGFDAGKLIKGKKRHILVDTLDLLLHAIVHSAGIQDRDGGVLLLATLFGQFPFLQKLFADSAYQGPIKGRSSATRSPKSCPVSKPKSSNDPRKSRGSYNCPSVGSSNARSHGSTAAVASPRTGKISTAAPSRS